MAFTTDDAEDQRAAVAVWLVGDAEASIDTTLLDRVIGAVIAHAADHYDITTDPDDDLEQALIMECARLYTRKHSQNGYVGTDELGAVRVTQFDPDVRRLLAGRLITAGIFGPSENTAES